MNNSAVWIGCRLTLTNGVIYLPVVVKGAMRVGGKNADNVTVRQGPHNKHDSMSNAAL